MLWHASFALAALVPVCAYYPLTHARTRSFLPWATSGRQDSGGTDLYARRPSAARARCTRTHPSHCRHSSPPERARGTRQPSSLSPASSQSDTNDSAYLPACITLLASCRPEKFRTPPGAARGSDALGVRQASQASPPASPHPPSERLSWALAHDARQRRSIKSPRRQPSRRPTQHHACSHCALHDEYRAFNIAVQLRFLASCAITHQPASRRSGLSSPGRRSGREMRGLCERGRTEFRRRSGAGGDEFCASATSIERRAKSRSVQCFSFASCVRRSCDPARVGRSSASWSEETQMDLGIGLQSTRLGQAAAPDCLSGGSPIRSPTSLISSGLS